MLMSWLAVLVWIIVPLAAWLTAWLIRRRAQTTLMRGVAVVAGLAILSTPWLISSGVKAYYDRQVRELCAKDGGVRVYETVRLPAGMFDQWGNVGIQSKQRAKQSDAYYFESEVRYLRHGNPEIRRNRSWIIRRVDGMVLGESIRYARAGGDLPGPWERGTSFSCPAIADAEGKIESSIFQKGTEQ